jgi:hypothetical protein
MMKIIFCITYLCRVRSFRQKKVKKQGHKLYRTFLFFIYSVFPLMNKHLISYKNLKKNYFFFYFFFNKVLLKSRIFFCFKFVEYIVSLE